MNFLFSNLKILFFAPINSFMSTSWEKEAELALNKIFALQKERSQRNEEFTQAELQNALTILIETTFGRKNNPGEVVVNGWLDVGSLALGVCNSHYSPLTHEECLETLVKKHRDYGPKNIARFSEPGLPGGLLVRSWDKVARIENLTGRGVDPENESLRDSFLDLVNYAAIGLMIEKDVFGLPFNDH